MDLASTQGTSEGAYVSSVGQADVGSWEVIREATAAGDDTAERVQVQSWLDSFRIEKNFYSSMTACAELFYAKVLSATEHLQEPNLLRTASCMMLIEQIICLFGRYKPLMVSLCNHLYAAIFVKEEGFEDTPQDMDEGLEQILSKKYIKKTYFGVYTELLKRYNKLVEKTANTERSLEVISAVLERAITLWQKKWIGDVFRQWRDQRQRRRTYLKRVAEGFAANIAMVKKKRAIRNWVAMDEYEQKRLNEEGKTKAGSLVEKLQNERETLLDELESLRRIVEAKDIKINIILSENKSLKIEKKRVLERCIEWQRQAARLSSIVSNTSQELCSAHFDWLARKRVENLVHLPGAGCEFLVQWAKELIARYCEDNTCRDFLFEAPTGKPYLYLLRSVAPSHCSEVWLIRNLSESDPHKRCAAVISLAKKLGVHTAILPEDLLSASLQFNYIFLAQIFRRFAQPELGAESYPRLWCDATFNKHMTEEKRHESPETIQPDEWQQRLEAHRLQNQMWRMKLSQVTMTLEAEITESLRHDSKKTTVSSEEEQTKLAQFYDLPIVSYADLLTALSGDAKTKDVHVDVIRCLRLQVRNIRNVYKFYSARDVYIPSLDEETDPIQRLSNAQFQIFCEDCNIPPGLIPDPAAMSSRLEQNSLMQERDAKTDYLVGPAEFSLVLVYIAFKMYDDEEFVDRVRKFIAEVVVPNAQASSLDTFRNDVADQEVQSVFHTFWVPLKRIFAKYSMKEEQQRLAPKSPRGVSRSRSTQNLAVPEPKDSMSFELWEDFVRDYDLFDGLLDSSAVLLTFHNVQDDSEDGSSTMLDYGEWTDALVAIAIFKNPSPFEPLSTRVNRFLRTTLRLKL